MGVALTRAVQALFPSLVYSRRLRGARTATLNRRLLAECRQLALDDEAGRAWSRQNYPGGYTSYGSVSHLHELSPTFAALRRVLDRHVRRFASALGIDLAARPLAMTDCWANIMPAGIAHGSHLHPLATVSGTWYVRTPRGAAGLKLEDPRLDRFMASPPRSAWMTLPVAAGQVILFESWMRHEVPASTVRGERVSISFNYNWF